MTVLTGPDFIPKRGYWR